MGRFYSDNLERAIELLYFQNDDTKYPEALSLLQKAAELREADAYYFLARCYAWGDGGQHENSQSAQDYSRSGIEMGSDLAILGAERMDIFTGELRDIAKHSLQEAFDAVLVRAEAEDAMAQYAIGQFYFWGDMLIGLQDPSPQDYDRLEKENAQQALRWFQAAAEQGCIPAFRNAYASVRDGKNGVPKDVRAAVKYAESLIDKVDIPAPIFTNCAQLCENLGMFRERNRWLERGLEKGIPECYSALGIAYLTGKGVAEHKQKAFSYFQKGAALEDATSLYQLGRCYCYGIGTPEKDEEAFRSFQKAAACGNKDALYFLAWFYFDGIGTKIDEKKAFYWATHAVESGCAAAKIFLGKCYLYGCGVRPNPSAAKRYLTETLNESGNPEAYYCLGEIYDHGFGVPENLQAAVAYYHKALQAGYQPARAALNKFRQNFLGKWKRV